MNRRRGKHLCRIREQNQLRHSVVAVPDSGILDLQTEEDVKYDAHCLCAETPAYAAAALPVFVFPLAAASPVSAFLRSTSSITDMGAASPGRLRVGTMRV